MDSRRGALLTANQKENMIGVVNKPTIKPLVTKRRPAFGDVGTNITRKPDQNVQKKAVLPILKPVLPILKPVLPISKPAIVSKPSVKPVIDTTKRLENIKVGSVLPFKRPPVTTKIVPTIVQRPAIKTDIANIPAILQKKPTVITSKQICGIFNIDKDDEDPLLVAEYVQDIMDYLNNLETQYSITKNYMRDHKSTPAMRKILINWLFEVQMDFKLLPETLHLSVAIVDRYLQENKNIGSNTLQLVGVTALFMAAKYEEMYITFEIGDLVYLCDNAYTRKDILQMECTILKSLNFFLGRPISLVFLRRFSKVAQVSLEQHDLSKYLLELALLEYSLCHINPSILAAAACCLSNAILNDVANPQIVWTNQLIFYTKYTYADIHSTICDFCEILLQLNTTKCKQKYGDSKFSKVSANPKLKGLLVQKLAKQNKNLKK